MTIENLRYFTKKNRVIFTTRPTNGHAKTKLTLAVN